MKTLNPQIWMLIAFVLLNGLLSAGSLALPEDLDRTRWLNGVVAADIEDVYDDEQPLRQFSINAWTAFSYLVFNEGKPGVVIGPNQWLYTEEEFLVETRGDAVYQRNLQFIEASAALLKRDGISLIVVVLPSKSRVYPVGTRQTDNPVYGRFLNDLAGMEVPAIDGLAALKSVESGEALFLKTDTHWTPSGAKRIAESVGDYIGGVDLKGDAAFETEEIGSILFEGDLTKFLPLSPWFTSLAPGEEKIPVYETRSLDTPDLFDDVSVPDVALVGTSYSANPMWHFEGFLKSSLSRDLVNVAREGEGPFKPMQTFLSEQRPDLEMVIWEIPERYLINPEYSLNIEGV